jgi:hypothetical protein
VAGLKAQVLKIKEGCGWVGLTRLEVRLVNG